jgi:SsrA-binding protein
VADEGRKLIARNRKARHAYEIIETFEAGLVLVGSEIKSIREGQISLGEGHVRIEGGEAFLHGVNISPYEQANIQNHDPLRPRKLLLHHSQIERLRVRVEEKGLAIVPLSVYLTKGRAKIEIGVARGKKHHDRREESKRRDESREAEREAARAKGRS